MESNFIHLNDDVDNYVSEETLNDADTNNTSKLRGNILRCEGSFVVIENNKKYFHLGICKKYFDDKSKFDQIFEEFDQDNLKEINGRYYVNKADFFYFVLCSDSNVGYEFKKFISKIIDKVDDGLSLYNDDENISDDGDEEKKLDFLKFVMDVAKKNKI
jgi:hypothetical protein